MRRLHVLLIVIAAGALTYVLWPSGRAQKPDVPAEPTTAANKQPPILEVPTLPTGRVSAGSGSGQIKGVVQDESNAPVAGVAVAVSQRIKKPYRDQPGPWAVEHSARAADVVARLRTDAKGRFVCTGLESDNTYYDVRAEPDPPRTGSYTTVRIRRDHESNILLRVRTGCALEGRVVEQDGSGVEALVSVTWRRNRYNRTIERWRRLDHPTAADGGFLLPAVPVGLLQVAVRVPGRVALEGLRVVTPHEGPFVIRLGSADSARVTGRITDSAGTAIAGARLLVAGRRIAPGDRRASEHLATTDANGAYALALPAPLNVTHMRIAAEGFVSKQWKSMYRPYAVGATDTLDFVLLRGAHVRGQARTEDGRALRGVRVRVTARNRPRRGDPEAVTDESGAFDLGGFAPGEYSLWAELEGYKQQFPTSSPTSHGRRSWWPGPAQRLVIKSEGAATTADVTMLAGSPIVGRVVDEKGQAVAGARVWLGRREKGAYPRGDIRSIYGGEGETRTDQDGRFRFVRRPDGKPFYVIATTDDALSDVVRLQPTESGEPVEGVLTVRRGAVLAGVVHDADGAPLPFAKYVLRGVVGQYGEAGRDGGFRVPLLPAGQYEIAAHGPFAAEAVARVLAWGEVVDDIVIKAPKLHVITGVLVDGKGHPLADTRVTFEGVERKRRRGSGQGSASTDAKGRFRVEGLIPGAYRARVGLTSLELTVEAGSTGVRLVHVRLPWTEIRGRVIDPAGHPVASGTVYVSVPSPYRQGSRTGRSAPILNGTFRIGVQMRDGPIELRVQDPRDTKGVAIDVAPQRWEDLAVEDGPFQLRLQAGGVVAGIVVDSDGQGVSGVQVEARHGEPVGRRGRRREGGSAVTGADGRFRFEGLTPGMVMLRLRAPPQYLAVEERTVATGTEDVRFELHTGGFVEGRVFEADGSPAANVPVQAEPRNHPVGPWGQGTTAEDGTFRLVGLDPNIEYRVRTDFDHRRGGRKDLLRIPSDWVRVGATGIEIRLVKGVFITGRVLTPDGKPLTTGMAVAHPKGEGRTEGGSITRLEKADGTFSLGPLMPGRYEVTAHGQDPRHGRSTPLIVEAPASGVELRLESRLTRRGVVHGENVEHFRLVWWARKADGTLVAGRGGTDKQGHFTIGQMIDLPGTVFVYSRKDGRCARIENVRPSEKPLDVHLVEGLTITGRVKLPPGKKRGPLTMVMAVPKGVHLYNLRSEIDAEGNFRIRGLPKGTFVVRYHDFGKQGPEVEVEAGATGVELSVE